MNEKEAKKTALFSIPQETSWHFERILKPDDKTIDNYVLIQPGAPDIVKVMKAYSHHPVTGYNIASIEIVYNEQLNRVFFGNMTTMNKRKGNPKFTPTWKTETQGAEKQHREATHQSLQKFAEPHADATVPNVMILPLWHGTTEAVSEHIFNTGYGIFNSNNPEFVTDDGFFGRGIYTAHEAEYAYRCYAQKHGDKGVLLLSWVSLFEAYPIVHGDMPKVQGKPIGYDHCDAHFIPVRSNQHPNTVLYYPCDFGEKSHYTEVVVFNPAQCLPRYRVKLLKSTPQPSIDDTALTNYQMGLDFLGLSQYAQVSNAFEEAHDAGHPAASIRLHWLHSGASGVIPANAIELSKYPTVSKETMAWLKTKASFRGGNDHEAQFSLAWCHQNGLGVEINLAKAAQYYWVAATQGHRDAQYQFGVCCSAGIGVQQNMREAIAYYQKAATQNHVHAHYVLSQCYTFGLGVLPDAAKATGHTQAAQKGRHPLLRGQAMGGQPPTTTAVLMTTMITEATSPQTPIPCNHGAEITSLKTGLAQKESELKQLNQALLTEKQISQTKDKTLAEKEKEIQRQRQTLLTKDEQLGMKDFENQQKEVENQQLSTKIHQLETALQAASDRELALKMELNNAQRWVQPSSVQPPQGNWSSGLFTTPSPLSPSPVRPNQANLTAAQQVAATSKAVQGKIDQKELAALLKWVTEGQLVEVEKCLKKNPTLGLGTGTVTDRSERTFTNVTVLQYAAWALDAEMSELIIGYLGADNTSIQLKALAEEPERYSSCGASYDYTPLVTKTQTYVENCDNWDVDKCRQYWQKEVGGEQRKCPAWLIYAWSEGGENVAWTKKM